MDLKYAILFVIISIIKTSSAKENDTLEGVQNLLVAIHERLQNLDDGYGIQTPRGRVENQITLDTRLRKIEDKVGEFVRKLDDLQERFNHKLGYLEARLDLGLQKIQANIEASNSRSDRALKVTVNKINEIKHFCNTSSERIRTDRRITSVEQIDHNTCNVNSDKIVDRLTRNIAQQINQANGDIWHRLQSTESLIWRLNNASRTDTKERLIQISDTASEISNIAKNGFGKMELAQDFFLSTCHRIQVNEEILTTKYTKVLEKILDIILHNSSRTYEGLESAQELIKYHDAHISHTLSDTEKMVLSCQEEGKATRKIIADMQETLRKDWNKQHNSIVEDVKQIQNIMQDFEIERNKTILTTSASQNELLLQIMNILQHFNYNNIVNKNETMENKKELVESEINRNVDYNLDQNSSSHDLNQSETEIDSFGNNTDYTDPEGADIQDYDETEEDYLVL